MQIRDQQHETVYWFLWSVCPWRFCKLIDSMHVFVETSVLSNVASYLNNVNTYPKNRHPRDDRAGRQIIQGPRMSNLPHPNGPYRPYGIKNPMICIVLYIFVFCPYSGLVWPN